MEQGSVHDNQANSPEGKPENIRAIEPNTVPLEDAVKWTKKWRDAKDKPDVAAFKIPGKDLLELYADHGWQDVRGYMAIKPDGTTTMLLVGVDKNGKDMTDPTLNQFVYDFTGVCPTLCDLLSPLFKG